MTINYRVGADGFLYLDDGIANLGLLDQIAALEWVRDNIAAFGGDPANVTIFGESAGALSVATLLAVPRAKGLFRRAIAQSGAAHHATPAPVAKLIGHHLAEKLGVAPMREAIKTVPVDRLLTAQAELKADIVANPDPARWGEVAATMLPWQPVIDGEVLPARPIDCVAAGAGRDVDLIVGTNTDEHRLFLAVSGALDQVTEAALAGAIAAYGLRVESALATYRAANRNALPGELLAAVQTDWYWRLPAIRLADAHAKGRAATFMYEFAWRSPQYGGLLGACHALDIPFVFDTLGERTEPLLGQNPPQELADAMHSAWVRFAATGDCGWPKYEPPHLAVMRFDRTSKVVHNPWAAERALWEGVR